MKKFITILTIAISFYTGGTFAQEASNKDEIFGSKINSFKGSYKEFTEAAAKQDKPVMLLFCRKGCHSCSNLKRGLVKTDIAEFFNSFYFTYFVDVNKEKMKLLPLSEKFKITGTPFFVFMTPDGRELFKDDIHSNKDSVIETCAKVLHKYMDVQRFLKESKCGNDALCQKLLAEKFVLKYKMENSNLSPRQYLEQAFTYGEPRLLAFNQTFIELAQESNDATASLFEVENISDKDDKTTGMPTCKASKRLAKWKKWSEE